MCVGGGGVSGWVCAHNYVWDVFVCVNSVCVHIGIVAVAVMFEWFMD